MRIACVLADDFEDSELRVPYDELRRAGHEVVLIGAKAGQKIKGKQGKEKVKVELGIDEARPEEFDALFIPGGYSPDHLRNDPRFVRFVKAFEDRPIMAICHGPQLLMTAGLARGRRMTAWPTVQGDLRYAGADVVDEPAVADGNLVTSRMPDDLPMFIERALEVLRESAQPTATV